MISIHPGHFGKGTGAARFIDEGEEAIKVAKRVHQLIKEKVKTTYIQDNVNKSRNANINWLVKRMNESRAKTHYSIHFNASKTTDKPVGTEVIVYSNKNSKHAGDISKAISGASGLINRGVKYNTSLGVLRRTHAPTYLIEVCFVDSKRDVEIYRKNFDGICKAIAGSILEFHGIKGGVGMQNELDALKKEIKELRELVGNGEAGKTLEKEVERGVELGITDGKNMGKPVTREQAVAMIVRAVDK